MSIPSVSPLNTGLPPIRTPEPVERTGHERDHDADDKASNIKPQSIPTGGGGGIVNTKA